MIPPNKNSRACDLIKVIRIDLPFAGRILRDRTVTVAFDFSTPRRKQKQQRRHNNRDGAFDFYNRCTHLKNLLGRVSSKL